MYAPFVYTGKVFWEVTRNNFEKNRASDGTITDGYCRINVQPKLEKVRNKFSEKAKTD